MEDNKAKNRILNIDQWSVDNVCDWFKGTNEKTYDYIDLIRLKQVNGKKLLILEQSDLIDIGIKILDHRLIIYNLVQNLICFKHDLNNDTLHSIIINTRNRVICLLHYIEKLQTCSCKIECYTCNKLNNDIIRLSTTLTTSCKKLLSWLARLPFTRLSILNQFRDQLNNQMKLILKLFKKISKQEDFHIKLSSHLFRILDDCNKTLDLFEETFDEDPDKKSLIYNYCYLEKVILRKRSNEQLLGLTLTKLLDGLHTVAEIEKDSSSDDCAKLSVGDDILAINNQVIIGWSSSSINDLLQNTFDSTESFVLLLRKMPRENLFTIKQQRILNNITLPNMREKKRTQKIDYSKKHSIADVFLSDQDLLDESSESDTDIVAAPIYTQNRHSGRQLVKNDSRRIQSMQNLHINKSRSNSVDTLDNNKDNLQIDTSSTKERKKSDDTDSSKTSIEYSLSKSDRLRALLFSGKHRFSRNKKTSDHVSTDASVPGTPNLLKIRKIVDTDSQKPPTPSKASKPPLNSSQTNQNTNKKQSTKYYIQQKQRPIYQSWLFKRKLSNSSSTSRHNIIRTISKWHHYWCILMKDYIIFNKEQDDKTPKDYILLRNFTVQRTKRQLGFKIIDHSKEIEHEFYAENADEFKEWFQHLFELRIKFNEKEYQAPPPTVNLFEKASRESSPGSSSRMTSRDSSPAIISMKNFKSQITSDDSDSDILTSSPKQFIDKNNNHQSNSSTIKQSKIDDQDSKTSSSDSQLPSSPTKQKAISIEKTIRLTPSTTLTFSSTTNQPKVSSIIINKKTIPTTSTVPVLNDILQTTSTQNSVSKYRTELTIKPSNNLTNYMTQKTNKND